MIRFIIFITLMLTFQLVQGRAVSAEEIGSRVIKPDLARSGWLQTPEDLTQLNIQGASVSKGAELEATSLSLSGKTASCALNDCPWNYSMEVELRPATEAFTDNPTHRSQSLARSNADCNEVRYPALNVAGLVNGTAYKWQAREKVVVYETSYKGQELACINPKVLYSGWEGHGDSSSPSFVVAALSLRTMKGPIAVVKMEGSGSDGSANRLNIDDKRRYYRVWATVLAPYTTSWYAVFSGVDERARNFTISYKGYNSQRCDQRLDIWDWGLSEWVELDSQEVGEEETRIDGLVPPGDLSSYISKPGAGEVRVRVQCSSDRHSFSSNGNTLKIAYDKPISTR